MRHLIEAPKFGSKTTKTGRKRRLNILIIQVFTDRYPYRRYMQKAHIGHEFFDLAGGANHY